MKKEDKEKKHADLTQRRTELAHERTILSYLRTFAALIVFGVALISLAGTYGSLFSFVGYMAISGGIILGIAAGRSYGRHRQKWKEMGLNS